MFLTSLFTNITTKKIIIVILLIFIVFFALNYLSYYTIYKYRAIDSLELRNYSKDKIDFLLSNRSFAINDFFNISILYIINIVCATVIIYFGSILFNIKLYFKQALYCVVIAMFVFVIQYIAEFMWLWLVQPDYTSFELMGFTLFSVLQFFDINTLPSYLIYCFQTINLWEMLFVLALAYNLSIVVHKPFGKTLSFTLLTYGVALLFWILIIMCLSVFLN